MGKEGIRMKDIYEFSQTFSGIFPRVEETTTLTKEELLDNLSLIIAPALEEGNLDKEVFVSNYIYISQRVISDLCEINERLQQLKQLDNTISVGKDYEHKKLAS